MLFAILILLFFSWIFGVLVQLVFRIKSPNDIFFDAFQKKMLGLLSIIFIYAVWITNFNTIMFGFPLVAVLSYLRIYRNNHQSNFCVKSIINNGSIKGLLIGLSFGVCFFFFQASFFYSTPFNNVPHGDYVGYYAKIIDFLNYEGVESRTKALYLILNSNDSPSPYHYPELWMAAMISEFLGVLSVESFTIAVHSILASILVIGMLALSSRISNSLLLKIVSIFFIFVSGISLFNILPQTQSYIFAIGWNPKVMFVSILFIWGINLMIGNNRYYYLPLLLLPIVNMALAPAVFISLVLLALINIVYKRLNIRYNALVILDCFIIAGFIFVFYYLNSGQESSGDFNLQFLKEGLLYDITKPLKIIMGSFVIMLNIYVIYALPILLLLLINKTKLLNGLARLKNAIILFSLMLFSGIISWSFTHPVHDSMQFFYMPVILFLNIILFLIYAIGFNLLQDEKKYYNYVYSAFIFILILYNLIMLNSTSFYKFSKLTDTYSVEFLHQVKSELSAVETDNEINLIGYISSNQSGSYWHALAVRSGGYYLSMLTSNFYNINLNSLNTNLDGFDFYSINRIKSTIENSALYNYAKINAENYTGNDIQRLQFGFVMDNNIKILHLDRGTELPNLFEPYIESIIEDEKSGHKLVFLNM